MLSRLTRFGLVVAMGLLTQLEVAAAAPIKVACIGEHTTHSDSFSATNRESQPPGKQEYPAMLQTLLGANYEVRNFGDCCGTVLQGYTPSETHPYVNGALGGRGPGYNESLTFLPDIVVIGSWGRHDWGKAKNGSATWSLTAFQKDYDDLVQRYMKLASHPKIYVSLPIPILFGMGDQPDNGVTTSSVLPTVKAVAAKYKLPIIDLYTPFLNHKELFKEEGEHVTDGPGLKLIADTVYAALTQNPPVDAGVDDAGSGTAKPDAAVAHMDAGGAVAPTPHDAGAPHAGSSAPAADAAAGAAGSASAPTKAKSGCGCSIVSNGSLPSPFALLGYALFVVVAARAARRRLRRPAWARTFTS